MLRFSFGRCLLLGYLAPGQCQACILFASDVPKDYLQLPGAVASLRQPVMLPNGYRTRRVFGVPSHKTVTRSVLVM